MSLLMNPKKLTDMPIDGMFVLYGAPGSGKTVILSTFPKTKEAPLLILDVLEDGTSSIDPDLLENIEDIHVVQIESYEDFEEVIGDLFNGFSIDKKTKKKKILKYSGIGVDTVTQLEFLIKQELMKKDGKSRMTQQLWGDNGDEQNYIYNMFKKIHRKYNCPVVLVAHEKKIEDDQNPDFNKVIPALMINASRSLCAKASFVWYTKIESIATKNPKTNEIENLYEYYTYIDRHPYLDTKCRKPVSMKIPTKVKDLTYPKFKKYVLDEIARRRAAKIDVEEEVEEDEVDTNESAENTSVSPSV